MTFRSALLHAFIVLCAFLPSSSKADVGTCVTAPIDSQVKTSYPVFDTMSFHDKPDTGRIGMRGMHFVDEADLFLESSSTIPKNVVQSCFKSMNTSYPVLIDIERWPVYPRGATATGKATTVEQARESIQKFRQLVKWIRAVNPNLKIGFYGVIPVRSYFVPTMYIRMLGAPFSPYFLQNRMPIIYQYDEWQANNNRLADLAKEVDFISPSLYSFYSTAQRPEAIVEWNQYAEQSIREARRVAGERPIFPVLWPHYHPNGIGTSTTELVNGEFWEKQLSLMRSYADGVIVWGNQNAAASLTPGSWMENQDAEWWEVTQRFMTEIRK